MALLLNLALKKYAAPDRGCDYLMAPDAGTLHIAAAAGAKTVSIFHATDGNRNASYGPGHRFVQAPMPCTGCLRKRCGQDEECRRSISPEAVPREMAILMEKDSWGMTSGAPDKYGTL